MIPDCIDGLKNACTLKAVKEVSRLDDQTIIKAFLNNGYKPNDGMYHDQWTKAAEELGLHLVEINGFRSATLAEFLRNHTTGVYFVSVRGHALVVRDGKVIDYKRGARRRVLRIKKVMYAPVVESVESAKLVFKTPILVKRPTAKSFWRYKEAWEYVTKNPQCSIEDIFANTSYTRADYRHDKQKGFIC